MSKAYSWFLTALFCAFLGAFALWGVFSPDRDFSPDENRVLAQRPALTLYTLRTGKFMSDYETYVTDQFPLRDGWIAGKAWAERLSGKKENNGVYFGGLDEDILIPRFTAPDEKRLTDNINYVNQFIENTPVPVTFGLIPTAATVWAERVPGGAPNYDQRLVIDRAARVIPGTVDLYPVLREQARYAIYYRTDHHWTSLGAYWGYVGLSEALGYDPAPLGEKTTVTAGFNGTSYSSSGVRWAEPDEIDVYVPDEGITVTSYTGDKAEKRQLYDYAKLDQKDKYAFFLGGQQPLCVIKTSHPDKPRLLIVRDSYTDSLAPFLTQDFSQLHLVDLRYYKGSLQEYIREQGIDRVLVLYSVPNFVSDANLVWLTR